jgi:hypothetical protein
MFAHAFCTADKTPQHRPLPKECPTIYRPANLSRSAEAFKYSSLQRQTAQSP